MRSIEQDFHAIWRSRTGDLQIGHAHFWDRALSRRAFLTRAAGVAGAAVAAPVAYPGVAFGANTGGAPNPIPGGTQVDGLGFFHFYFPTTTNPVGATDVIANGRGDPSTITDFNGFIGVGEWGGGTGKDGTGTTLYWAADLRFMDGEYVDVNGRHSQGAFAFVWLDIFEDVGLTSQVHDFNPGISSTGVFWTAPIDRGSVRIALGSGSAALHVSDLEVEDYGNVVNALMDGPSVDATVSFDVSWHGVVERVNIRNGTIDLGGEFVRNEAELVWSAEESGFTFQSDPLTSDFATLGHERNGVFFS